MSEKRILKIGSRKSELALIQTYSIIEKLKTIYADQYDYEVITMTTTGDQILNQPLSTIGSKALFTKELEQELLEKSIDFIVHSCKDLPTSLPNGCIIAAILKREDPNDAIILRENSGVSDALEMIYSSKDFQNEKNVDLKEADEIIKNQQQQASSSLPSTQIVIGTSSVRRIAQIKYHNANIKCVDIRGNLNTRFKKLDDKQSPFTALILATAGVQRLGYANRISAKLDHEDWYYAVGQGALAVECRAGDQFILNLLKPLTDEKTYYECLAERVLMQQLEGGCSVPIGVRCCWRNFDDNGEFDLKLNCVVYSLNGEKRICVSEEMNLNDLKIKQLVSLEAITKSFTNIVMPNVNEKLISTRFINSAYLGYKCAMKLNENGAMNILHTIKSTRDILKL